jgi:hypothetical protein
VRYQVPSCDQAPRTVETPENGGTALPNSAARTASSALNLEGDLFVFHGMERLNF